MLQVMQNVKKVELNQFSSVHSLLLPFYIYSIDWVSINLKAINELGNFNFSLQNIHSNWCQMTFLKTIQCISAAIDYQERLNPIYISSSKW